MCVSGGSRVSEGLRRGHLDKKSVNGLDAGHEKLKKGNRQWGLRQREGLIKIHAIF